jgi:hypothetical protein
MTGRISLKYDKQETFYQMSDRVDSLESRLQRLTPEQRREVGDFIDFLLRQAGTGTMAESLAPPLPSFSGVAPPPLTPEEPPGVSPAFGAGSPHPVGTIGSPFPVKGVAPVMAEIDPHDDLLTHEYMDYGQFDQTPHEPSPSETTVEKVRVKMGRKEVEEPSRHILDWID